MKTINCIELRVVLDTTLCDKVCQLLAASWWFSPGTPVSSTNKINRHDITEKTGKFGQRLYEYTFLRMCGHRTQHIEKKKQMSTCPLID